MRRFFVCQRHSECTLSIVITSALMSKILFRRDGFMTLQASWGSDKQKVILMHWWNAHCPISKVDSIHILHEYGPDVNMAARGWSMSMPRRADTVRCSEVGWRNWYVLATFVSSFWCCSITGPTRKPLRKMYISIVSMCYKWLLNYTSNLWRKQVATHS